MEEHRILSRGSLVDGSRGHEASPSRSDSTQSLEGQRVLVTGGSRGLGLALVEALVERKALVTVLARDEARLAEVKKRLNVSVVAGDTTDAALATRLLRDVRPTVLVLNAAASPGLGPIHEQTWEGFSRSWNTDLNFGTPMLPAQVAEHIVSILTEPKYESGTAWGLKGDLGIHSLDT